MRCGIARHFLCQGDLSREEIYSLFARASELKKVPYSKHLLGRSLVMFFEKASTRTRLSFEIGMTQLGGHAVYIDPASSQLSRGESIADTGRVTSRYADLLMARVYSHDTLTDLAHNSTIPVINGLSDIEHPCQSMADFFTIWERRGALDGLRMAYVGDGNNNVTHSLMIGAALLGVHMVVASPPHLSPLEQYRQLANDIARGSGGSFECTESPVDAVRGADVVYTDVWVSMGRELELASRVSILTPYQVNVQLLSYAAPECLFMHCLPAHIGQEVTEEVAYGPQSIIFDEAENRLHIQKALMLFLSENNEELGG
ncbi:MAG: ornithine carbamoyltransferase [Chloroflexota bacterium]